MKRQPVARLMIAACVALAGSVAGRAPEGAPAQPLNVLVISIDDLNDYAGCLGGHPDARTPNLDRLAKRGVLFTRAYCNAPVCNPSRASIWTGLRPTTTGIVSNPSGWFRDRPGFRDVVTLPQALAAAGYTTTAYGKIFHLGHGNSTVGEVHRFNPFGYGPYQDPKLHYPMGDRLTDWGIPAGDDELASSFDPVVADRTVEALTDRHSQPFFLGCGLFRPHTPLYAAQRWFDLHPLDRIRLPKTLPNDTDDLVVFGKLPRREQDIEAPGLFTQDWVEKTGNWKPLVQAYLASTSAMDHQLGRVIDALDRSPYRDTTLVIVFSDHGWHLGEKRHWGKAALWEKTTRVPFIIAGPGIPRGVRCDRPVDLLSIYPTVMDYTGLTPPGQVDGVSLRPLLENTGAAWDRPVLTTFVDHHALRTDRWRYIRYAGGEEELYDHDVDPDEFENLAVTRVGDADIRRVVADLRLRLAALLPPEPDARTMELVDVRKIWDEAPHSAFTDLIRFKGKWYCAFREGQGHVSDDGRLRVLRSDDGEVWTSVARMDWEDGDARDAKLSITPRGELMLNGAVRFLTPVDGNRHQSVTWLSADGEIWDGPFACPSGLGTWRWSVTWHDGVAYSFGYSGKDAAGCLYRSADGRTWESVKSGVFPDAESYGNETSLLFSEAGEAWCLLRRDKGSRTALLGVSRPPYKEWTWADLGVRIGGPKMIRDQDGRFLATVRLYDGGARTALCRIDPVAGRLTEIIALPSGGDTSYAGMVVHEGLLWISYYSSHEGKTAIHLARVRLPRSGS